MLGEAVLIFAGMVLVNGGMYEIAKAIREVGRGENKEKTTKGSGGL